MLKKIENFFYRLTINNWGFTWHFIIAKIAFDVLEKWLAVNLVFAICFVISLAYELYQLRKAKLFEGHKPVYSSEREVVVKQVKKQKTDSWQDMIANILGLLLGWLL